jgi:hypothetical protein
MVFAGLIALALTDIVLKAGGMRLLHSVVGNWPTRRCRSGPRATPEDIRNALQEACRLYPKRVLCLQHSAALTCLLRSLGFTPTLVLGCRQMPFAAHAWVELEGRVVNDSPSMNSVYQILDRL